MQTANIETLLTEICQKIGGEWLLIGGSLVILEFDGERATEDIDLVQIRAVGKSEAKAQDELFRAAFRIGLDPETVNSAARFFVSEVPGWESEILPFRTGPVGTVFRPSLTLFVALKMRRGTEIDLGDVKAAVKKEGAAMFDVTKFHALAGEKAAQEFARRRKDLGL